MLSRRVNLISKEINDVIIVSGLSRFEPRLFDQNKYEAVFIENKHTKIEIGVDGD